MGGDRRCDGVAGVVRVKEYALPSYERERKYAAAYASWVREIDPAKAARVDSAILTADLTVRNGVAWLGWGQLTTWRRAVDKAIKYNLLHERVRQ